MGGQYGQGQQQKQLFHLFLSYLIGSASSTSAAR